MLKVEIAKIVAQKSSDRSGSPFFHLIAGSRVEHVLTRYA
jgi:hypothetical protein